MAALIPACFRIALAVNLDTMDGYGNREAFAGNRAAPYFMAAFSLPDECAAVLKQNAPQLRIEAAAHKLQENPIAGCLILLEAEAHRLDADIDAVFYCDFRGDFPHAFGQSFVSIRFSNQADLIAHGNPHAGFDVVGDMHNKRLIYFERSIHDSRGYNNFRLLTNSARRGFQNLNCRLFKRGNGFHGKHTINNY